MGTPAIDFDPNLSNGKREFLFGHTISCGGGIVMEAGIKPDIHLQHITVRQTSFLLDPAVMIDKYLVLSKIVFNGLVDGSGAYLHIGD